ncbi:site-specific integrase [Sneathiella glossodoripedis]|uniref:site-specific integrase n=1 Tax=Sneathiella glossodoripedis TaxID=418853 RepID=UPI0004719F73|nr:site-specific integrase [Sneathiella glossodoripedis]
MPNLRVTKGDHYTSEPQLTALGKDVLPPSLQPALKRARRYLKAAHADTTQQAYHEDWTAYKSWCAAQGLAPISDGPGEPLVGLYLSDAADHLAPTTLNRRIFGIADGFYARGRAFDPHHPLLRQVMDGIYRLEGRPVAARSPLSYEELAAMVRTLGTNLRDRRDAALLLVGFFGAFRRSELCALTVADLSFRAESLKLLIRRAKNDARRLGQIKSLPRETDPALCPVAALHRWLAAAQLKEGAVFRSVDRFERLGRTALTPRSIARLVKSRYQAMLKATGHTDADSEERSQLISAHSLRSGYITRAGLKGDSLWQIRARSGHKTLEGVSRYIHIPD